MLKCEQAAFLTVHTCRTTHAQYITWVLAPEWLKNHNQTFQRYRIIDCWRGKSSRNLSFEDQMFLGTIKFPSQCFLQFNQCLITFYSFRQDFVNKMEVAETRIFHNVRVKKDNTNQLYVYGAKTGMTIRTKWPFWHHACCCNSQPVKLWVYYFVLLTRLAVNQKNAIVIVE